MVERWKYRMSSRFKRIAKGLSLTALGAAGAAAGVAAFGVMDYLYEPEFFRSGKKPKPTLETAPGKAEVTPSQVRAGEGRKTVTLVFRCGPGGISEGGGIKVALCRMVDFGEKGRRANFTLAHGWGPIQNRYPRLGNYYTCELRTSGGARLEVTPQRFFPWRASMRLLGRELLRRCGVELERLDIMFFFMEQRKIRLRVSGDRLQEGDEIVITLGYTRYGGKGWASPAYSSRLELAVEVDEKAMGQYRLISAVPELETIGREAVSLEAALKSPTDSGEGVLVLRTVDENGELDPTFEGEVELMPLPGMELPPRVEFGREDQGIHHIPYEVVAQGVYRVQAEGGGLSGTSNPLLVRKEGPRLFWGDIHAHTILCDGASEPSEFYHSARDIEGLDFAAISMHDTMEGLEPSGRTDEWELVKQLRDQFSQPGRFIVLLGYEWSDHKQGHRGVFYAPDEEEAQIFGFLSPEADTVEKLEGLLEDYEALVIPHHTAWRRIFVLPWNAAKFITMRAPEAYKWWGPENEQQRLVEIYSDHGSSERYDGPFPITHGNPPGWFPSFMRDDRCRPGIGNYVQEALADGLRLGIIAGSDRHEYAVNERIHPISIYPKGLTAVWAEELTAESLWRSLWNRRVYGTTGARIVVEFFADDLPMGTEYVCPSHPHLSGRVIGTAPLTRVELLRHDRRGYTTAWSASGGDEAAFDFVDEDRQGETFYYLRAEQEDDHLAWSSPIWLLR